MIGLVAYVALAAYVGDRASPPTSVSRVDAWLRQYPGSIHYSAASFVNGFGTAPVVVCLSVGLAGWAAFVLHRRDLALMALVGPAIAGLGQLVTKAAIDRPLTRTQELTGVHGHGFPSGHTTGAVAVATVAVVCAIALTRTTRRRVVGVAVAYAAAVAVSCVVIGAHRGLDVVGGAILGWTAVLSVAAITLQRTPTGSAAVNPGS